MKKINRRNTFTQITNSLPVKFVQNDFINYDKKIQREVPTVIPKQYPVKCVLIDVNSKIRQQIKEKKGQL